MRVMVLVKANDQSEAGAMPSEQILTDMLAFNEELVNAGLMTAGEGLHPTSKGKRVQFSGGNTSVVDGPFAETKELLAGFWIWKVGSMEEAVEWVKRMPSEPGEAFEIEIRPIFESADFAESDPTGEIMAKEDQLRARVEEGQAKPAEGGAPQHIFVNLPVSDLNRAVAFFTALGFTFNPQFTDENATCMVVSDTIYVMLLVENYFKTFTPKPVADAKQSTETLVALSRESREAVDRIVEAALAAGARRYAEPKDHGFMYQWGFEDLDGHIWEFMWMDPSFVQ